MKKIKLDIELGELYQLKTIVAPSFIFKKIPETFLLYKEGNYSHSFDKDISKMCTNTNPYTLEYFNPEKTIVIPKEIIWLKYSSSKIKTIDDCLWNPIVEVYSMKDNFKFYIKPHYIEPLKNGNDLNEDFKISVNDLKHKLLNKLKTNNT